MKYILCGILLLHTAALAQTPAWEIHVRNPARRMNVIPERVTPDSLIVRFLGEDSLAVSLSRINEVDYQDHRGSGAKGMVIGLLTGAAVGYVGGLIADGVTDAEPRFYSTEQNKKANLKEVATIVSGVVGAMIGYIIDANSGKQTLDLSGMSNESKYFTLMALLSGRPTAGLISGSQADVVRLKNGTTLRGTLTEPVADSTVTILTADSSKFVFSASEVARVAKDAMTLQPSTPSLTRAQQRDSIPWFRPAFHIGIGVPISEFGDPKNGGAKAGFGFGGELEYRFNRTTSVLGGLSVVYNPVDVPGSVKADSWSSLWPMVGIRLIPGSNRSVEFSVQAQIGMEYGVTPEARFDSYELSFLQNSATANSIAFSLGAGLLFWDRINLGVRYLYAAPEYERTTTFRGVGFSGTTTETIQVKTAIVEFSAGVVF